MKVLLDNGIPPQMRRLIAEEHEVLSSQYLGWQDLQNGELLQAAHEAAFDVLVTKETSIQHQQNLHRWKLGLIILRPERESRRHFYALADALSAALSNAGPGTVQQIGPRAPP